MPCQVGDTIKLGRERGGIDVPEDEILELGVMSYEPPDLAERGPLRGKKVDYSIRESLSDSAIIAIAIALVRGMDGSPRIKRVNGTLNSLSICGGALLS